MDNPSNWVKERGACSSAHVFETLRLQVKDDVETRQAMREKSEFGYPGSFSFHENGSSFSVLLQGPHPLEQRVTFSHDGKTVSVKGTDGKSFLVASPALDRNCQCIVKIGGQEYALWHMRMLALEHLFFDFI